jgi:hypothetical protein
VAAGGSGVAAEVSPVKDELGEDGDRGAAGAAGAAQRDGLVVFGLVVDGGGDYGQRDLEGLGIDHAQVGERGLDLVVTGLRQAWFSGCIDDLISILVRVKDDTRGSVGPQRLGRGCR